VREESRLVEHRAVWRVVLKSLGRSSFLDLKRGVGGGAGAEVEGER